MGKLMPNTRKLINRSSACWSIRDCATDILFIICTHSEVHGLNQLKSVILIFRIRTIGYIPIACDWNSRREKRNPTSYIQ